VSGAWSVIEILTCPDGTHAWRQWHEGDVDPDAGFNVGGRGGNQAQRTNSSPDDLIQVRDWALIQRFRYIAPSRLRADLINAVNEIGIRPVHKRTKFADVVRWVLDDLPSLAPTHPRTPDATDMATYWWRYRR
jgi:hypothetical protein